MAALSGLELNAVAGTGAHGKITKEDVEAALAGGERPQVRIAGGGTRVFASPLARRLAREMSIDIGALQRRRDRLVPGLRSMGYETSLPEGTFYVMARSPIADDAAFAELLAEHGALVLPGSIVEVPGWFRISLTASEAMVDRGLRSFETALEAATRG
jgi:aspartate/methionine/tyrosine aminotransferase